jgi:hypothetical protein
MRKNRVGRRILAVLVLGLAISADLVWATALSDVQGTLLAVNLQERKIVVREKLLAGDGKDITLTLAPKAQIWIEKREVGLQDLKVGDTVVVAFSQGKGGAVATYIERKAKAKTKPAPR